MTSPFQRRPRWSSQQGKSWDCVCVCGGRGGEGVLMEYYWWTFLKRQILCDLAEAVAS